MPSTYTLNNGIELIATGEQSGTWGDTTNTNLSLVDTALDGQVTVTLPSAGTSGSPNTLAISDGATSDGRNRMVIFNDGGDLGATAYVQLTPNDAEKIIYIRNDLAGSRSIILFQGTYNASNDYELPAGTTVVIYFDGAGSGAVAANVFNNAYFDSLRLGSVSVTAILDEDDMSSDSATALATQQSIKAYVDTQITAEDLDFAGDSGTGAVDLDSQTFTIAGTTNEIETSASGQTLTVGLPDDVTIAGDLTVDTDTLYVDSTNDRVGVGTTSPDSDLHISGTGNEAKIIIEGAANPRGNFIAVEGADDLVFAADEDNLGASSAMKFRVDATERMQIDTSGRLLIGLTSAIAVGSTSSAGLEVASTGVNSWISQTRFNNSNSGPLHLFGKSRSATVGTFGTVVQDDDALGTLSWAGDDGTDAVSVAAQIQGAVDGTPGANDMPGRLVFLTTADGAAAPTERMRITNDGSIGFGGVDPVVGYQFYTPSGMGGLLVSRATSQSTAPSHYISVDSSKVVNQIYGDNGFVFEIAAESGTLDEAYRIQANRNFTINTAHDVAVGSSAKAKVQILGTQDINLSITGQGNNTDGGIMVLGKTRGTYGSSNTIVQDGDTLGEIRFGGDDGVDIQSTGARIFARVSATPGANDMPGEVVIQTTSDGNASPSDRVIINETGLVSLINTNSVTSGNRPTSIYIARSDNNAIPVISMGPADEAQDSVSPGAMISSENRGFIIGTQNSLAATNMQGIHFNNANNTAFYSQGNQRMQIDGSGRVLINLTSDVGTSHKLQVNDDVSILTFNGTTTGADGIRFIKSRATTPGSNAIVADGDDVGFLDFRADDGTDYSTRTGIIASAVDGTPGVNDMPGRLEFYTTPDGGSSSVERMRIDNAGDISILEGGTVRGVWKVESSDNIHFGATSGGGAGLQFWGAGGTTPNIGPLKEMGASDNEIDFGRSSERFNDIFLGGGVRFDGGATANYLDDYEEGTWTPSLIGTSTAGTWTSSGGTPNGKYTKIGETYICTFELTGTLSGASGDVQIQGLPSSSGANDQGWYATWWTGFNTGVYSLFGHLTSSGAGLWVKQTTSASTTAGQMTTANLGTGNITIRGVAVIDDSF
jgi:hypothetical protein